MEGCDIIKFWCEASELKIRKDAKRIKEQAFPYIILRYIISKETNEVEIKVNKKAFYKLLENVVNQHLSRVEVHTYISYLIGGSKNEALFKVVYFLDSNTKFSLYFSLPKEDK